MRTPLLVSIVCLALVVTASACRKEGTDGADAVPAKPLVLVVKAEAPGQSFRYYDADARQFRTAIKADDIPEAARRLVMVNQESLPPEALVPGEMVLADLSRANADGTYAWRVVNTARAEAGIRGPASPVVPTAEAPGALDGKAGSPALAVGDRVLLFVTSWCPHCREAEAYLKQRGVPYQKLDVERDAGAQDLLGRLFREAKLPVEHASSVPILYVKGRVLLGFDRAELEKLI